MKKSSFILLIMAICLSFTALPAEARVKKKQIASFSARENASLVLYPGESLSLRKPGKRAGRGRHVRWTSSRPDIVSVTKKGVVTAHAPGKAAVTSTSGKGGRRKRSCRIEVKKASGSQPIQGQTTYVAHRGFRIQSIENSASAIESACQQGIQGIEFDIRMTADRKFVVNHDLDLNRVCGVPKKISGMSQQEACSYPFLKSIGEEAVPEFPSSLGNILNIFQRYPGVYPNIEIKDRLSSADLRSLMKTIDNYGLLARATISSRHRQNLTLIRSLPGFQNRGFKLQLVAHGMGPGVIDFCIANRLGISCKYYQVTHDSIRRMQKSGLEVSVGGVPDKDTADYLSSTYGVNIIASDLPL